MTSDAPTTAEHELSTAEHEPTTAEQEPNAEIPNAVLVGGPLAGRAIFAPALDQEVRLEDDNGVVQEYRPEPGALQSVEGQPVDLAVYHHYMPARDVDARES
jgi:hypothetical protein